MKRGLEGWMDEQLKIKMHEAKLGTEVREVRSGDRFSSGCENDGGIVNGSLIEGGSVGPECVCTACLCACLFVFVCSSVCVGSCGLVPDD